APSRERERERERETRSREPSHRMVMSQFGLTRQRIIVTCSRYVLSWAESVHLTYQYRLMPTTAQHRSLERILEMQRQLDNSALQEQRDAWRLKEKSITNFDQTKSLTVVRKDDPEGYGGLPVAPSRWTLTRLDLAYAAFFDRLKATNGRAGLPRFRGMNGWRSLGFSEFSGIRLIGSKLLFKSMPGRLKV